MKNLDWEIVSKKGVNFENLLISIVGRGFAYQKGKYFGPFYTKHYRQIDAHRDTLKKDIDRFIKQAKDIESKKPGSILKSYYDYGAILKTIERFADKLPSIDSSKLTNLQLANLLKEYPKIAGKSIWYAYNYYFYQYLGNELYAILKLKERDIKKQTKLFEILTQAKELSVMQKEQKELLLLIKKIKKENLDSAEVNNLIREHLRKFSHMGFFYFRGKPWTEDYIKKRISEKINTDFLSELKKIEELEKANKEWLEIVKKLEFNNKEIILVKTLKEMAYCTNGFDEVWNYLSSKSQAILEDITRRLKITYNELIEMDINEIIDFLEHDKQIDAKFREIIAERQKDSVLVVAGNKLTIITGKELTELRNKETKKEVINKNIKELKGLGASVGKAVGKVVLVLGVNDLSKVKKGDIMMAKSTVPSFVPAMEKAGAIITEVGGLLSHAAIVSRELSTPCIVGIDKVTEILKDGDIVEVDAEKGIVRRLK